MVKTIICCDRCKKEIKWNPTKIFPNVIDRVSGDIVETIGNTERDYCDECIVDILAFANESIEISENEEVNENPETEKMDDIKELYNSDESEEENEKSLFEKYGKVYALRNAGWKWKKIAGEILKDESRDAAMRICGSFNGYCKSHPESVEMWKKGE